MVYVPFGQHLATVWASVHWRLFDWYSGQFFATPCINQHFDWLTENEDNVCCYGRQVFSTPLYFSRQTGTFVELTNIELHAEADEHSWTRVKGASVDQRAPSDAAADEHRATMMLWARTERLPIFLRH